MVDYPLAIGGHVFRVKMVLQGIDVRPLLDNGDGVGSQGSLPLNSRPGIDGCFILQSAIFI